jgi:autotransporter translocation and assembly factor TamB
MMKRVFFGLLGVLVAAILLAALVLFFPPAFQFSLRTANRLLPVAVDIEAYHHVPGRLSLTGVRVATPTGTRCELTGLMVEYRPIALVLGRIEISTLELEYPRITIQRTPDGQISLFEPSTGLKQRHERRELEDKGSWTTMLGPLRVKRIRVAQGSVRFEDLASELSLVWESLDVEGNFTGKPLGGELYLREGRLQAGRDPQPPLQMSTQGHGSLINGHLQLARFQMTSEDTSVSLSGEYSLLEQKYSLDAELAQVPLDRLLALFGVGHVEVQHVSGTLKAGGTGEQGTLLEADLRGAVYGQQAEARLVGKLIKGQFQAESIHLKNAEAIVKGKASWDFDSGDLRGSFRLDASTLEESFRPYGVTGLRMQGLGLEGGLQGTIQDPEIRFRMRLGEVDYHEPLLRGVKAEGGYAARQGFRLTGNAEAVPLLREGGEAAMISVGLHQAVAACEIRTRLALDLNGRLHLKDRHAQVAVRANDLDLSFLTKGWMPSDSALTLTGKGSFQGNLDRRETWNGKAAIDELTCSFPELVIQSARPLEIRVEKGLIRGEAALEANGRPLSVHGSYPLMDEARVMLEGYTSLALEDFLLPARSFLPSLRVWKGDLRVQGTLEGPARAPRLRALAELSNGTFQLASSEEQETLRESEEQEGEQETEEGTKPKGILAGGVRVRLELDGSIKEPAGSLDLAITEGNLYGVPLDEIHMGAVSRDGKKWTSQATVRSAQAELSLDGWLEVPTGAISGQIRSTELNLAALLGSERLPIQGTSHIEGTVGGTIGSPRVELRSATESLAIQDVPVDNLYADLVYDPEELSLKGKTDTGWFEASVKMKEEHEFSFRGSLENLPLGPLLEAARLRGWNGQASLAGKLEGPVTDVERWEGEISLEQLDVRAEGEHLRLEEPVSFGFAKGNVTIPETCFLIGDSRLRMRGSLGRENSLAVKGSVPLRPFKTLIPAVRFHTGKAEIDLVIRGSVSTPSLDGRVHLEAGQVKVAALAYPADSIEADLRAASNRFTLEALSANVADGTLTASGAMTLEPLAFEEVRVSLKSVPIRLSESLVGNLHGELAFKGDQQDSLLRGNMRIIEARYEEDFNLVGAVLLPSRPRKVKVQKKDPFLKNMRLDLRIESGPNLFVRNNLGRLVLSTNMEITGTAAKPVPLGIIRVEEGRIFYSNKRFDITQGSLAFSDPSGGQPRLQLESKVKIQGQSREYSIYLTLMGPLDRIELELRSVPDLEREDIIYVLLTGKTRDEYYAAAEGTTDMEETAQRLAVSGIGTLFGGEIRAATGLDTFVMERTEGKEFGVKTTVGKQFNERVDVRGIFALGSGQEVSEAQVGYLLTDMFYIVGTQRTDGSFGLDFRVRIGSR